MMEYAKIIEEGGQPGRGLTNEGVCAGVRVCDLRLAAQLKIDSELHQNHNDETFTRWRGTSDKEAFTRHENCNEG